MSTLAVNTIQDTSSSGNAVLNGVASAPNSMGFRNRIINGGMAVDQRNAGASQTITAAATLAYTVDRWYAYCTGANVTGQRVAGSGANQYRYQFTGAASVTKIGFAQRIEAINSYDLNNATATLSVDLANSVLTTVTWVASYANSTDTFGSLASPTVTQIATGTFTVTSTVTRYSTNISIPSAATTGIQIEFSVGAQTSGTWTIGNVQLEAGTNATAFERVDYGRQLIQCQRYYEKSYIQTDAAGAANKQGYAACPVGSNTVPSGQIYSQICFAVVKRADPTITFYGFQGGSGKVSNSSSGADLAASSGTLNSSGTQGFNGRNSSGGTITTADYGIIYHWTASIEL